METEETNNKGKSPKKAATNLKANQLVALGQFGEYLRLLVAFQKNAIERLALSDDPMSIQMERLAIYDRFMPLLVNCFGTFDATLSPKHPGGAPRNEFRPLAFDLLTDHYINRGEMLSAKKLVKAVTAKLPEDLLYKDAGGKEPFSSRLAREVIKDFKACLRSHPDDWN